MESHRKASRLLGYPETVQPAPLELLVLYLPAGEDLWNAKGMA